AAAGRDWGGGDRAARERWARRGGGGADATAAAAGGCGAVVRAVARSETQWRGREHGAHGHMLAVSAGRRGGAAGGDLLRPAVGPRPSFAAAARGAQRAHQRTAAAAAERWVAASACSTPRATRRRATGHRQGAARAADLGRVGRGRAPTDGRG